MCGMFRKNRTKKAERVMRSKTLSPKYANLRLDGEGEARKIIANLQDEFQS